VVVWFWEFGRSGGVFLGHALRALLDSFSWGFWGAGEASGLVVLLVGVLAINDFGEVIDAVVFRCGHGASPASSLLLRARGWSIFPPSAPWRTRIGISPGSRVGLASLPLFLKTLLPR
jgi:hypothetical protein